MIVLVRVPPGPTPPEPPANSPSRSSIAASNDILATRDPIVRLRVSLSVSDPDKGDLNDCRISASRSRISSSSPRRLASSRLCCICSADVDTSEGRENVTLAREDSRESLESERVSSVVLDGGNVEMGVNDSGEDTDTVCAVTAVVGAELVTANGGA